MYRSSQTYVFLALLGLAACDNRAQQANEALTPVASADAQRALPSGPFALPPLTPCADSVGWVACLYENEPRFLAARSDVTRDSLVLRIDIDGRKPMEILSAAPDEFDGGHFVYRGWIPGLRAHAVHGLGTESDAIWLVWPTSGKRVILDEAPEPSPNGRYFLTTSWDTDAQMEPNRVQVFEPLPDSARLVWELEPTEWGPSDPIWLDDSTFTVRRRPGLGVPDTVRFREPLRVLFRRGAWVADSSTGAP